MQYSITKYVGIQSYNGSQAKILMTELIMAVHIMVFHVLVSILVLVNTFNSSWYVFQVLVISGPTYVYANLVTLRNLRNFT